MNINNTLPEGFLLRRPTMDDLKAVTELLISCDIAEYGEPDVTEDELRTDWQTPNWNLDTDAWVVIAPNGQFVGYVWIGHREHARLFTFARVHPDYSNTPLGTHLIRLGEERAQQHISLARPDARIAVSHAYSNKNQAIRHQLEQESYAHIRSSWRMLIEMEEVPVAPEWPTGITIRTFTRGQDEHTVFAMIDKAFQDHWGHTPGVFEQWEHWTIKREMFDPSLWFLAFDGDKLVGASLCTYLMDLGWIDTLAVLRAWRQHGLGIALLRHSFREFYRRGTYKVGLGVDAENLTGATRLYKRAGMHVARQYDTYEKELRSGVELSTQAIAV